ncbi:hypothetical protein N9933_03490 [bacterium]|nr:hypothetical protein [bacterium]
MNSKLSFFCVLCVMLIGLLLSPGCLYQSEDVLYPPEPVQPPGFCDTTVISYKTDVIAIMNDFGCIGCHEGGNAGGGVDLSTYANVKISVDSDEFLCSMEHGSNCSNMPQGGPKLSENKLEQIRCWIEKGALDN